DRHPRCYHDWSADVCSSDLTTAVVAYDPLVGGFQAHSLSVRKLPVGHTSLKGARALRQALGRGELAADVVLVDRARDIRLAAFEIGRASRGRAGNSRWRPQA